MQQYIAIISRKKGLGSGANPVWLKRFLFLGIIKVCITRQK